MRLFRSKKKRYEDRLEERFDTISELTRDLEKAELKRLLEAIQSVHDARQKLKGVKTNEEKENADIYEAEKILAKEMEK